MTITKALYLKEPLSLNTPVQFIRHISKFICICTKASIQNLVKIYRPGCIGQHNMNLISQVQDILVNE